MPKKSPKLTEEDIRRIETLSGIGLTMDSIALILNISLATLKRRLDASKEGKDALLRGRAIAESAVSKTLFEMARSGNCPTATLFWLKCRARWSHAPETIVNQYNVQQTLNSQAPKREITEQDRNRLLDVVLKLRSNPEDPQCKSILNSLQQSQQLEAQSSPARLVTACSDKKSQG